MDEIDKPPYRQRALELALQAQAQGYLVDENPIATASAFLDFIVNGNDPADPGPVPRGAA